MKFSWLTDIHLNFLNESGRRDFYQKILDTHCNAVFITGDIAEASVGWVEQRETHRKNDYVTPRIERI